MFQVLINAQRENGVRLIKGKSGSRAAHDFVECISAAVVEKLIEILSGSSFFSCLSDGSQARKTKSDKELVLCRVGRNGVPTYFVLGLMQMGDYGGTDAQSLKKAIDYVFQGRMCLSDEDYRLKFVSATADGASVNFGALNGLITLFRETREWLLALHCANHRVELAIKDSILDDFYYAPVDEFYLCNYYFLENSGPINDQVTKAAGAIGITSYKLNKVSTTRFIGHRKGGLYRLLHMWPAFIMGYENALLKTKKATTKAKVQGLLRKFCDPDILYKCCSYLDIVERITPASKRFEESELLPFELASTLRILHNDLDELIDIDPDDVEDVPIDSNLRRFTYTEQENEKLSFTRSYVKAGHEKRKPANREEIKVTMEGFSHSNHGLHAPLNALSRVAREIKTSLNVRFSDLEGDIFNEMKWFDPKVWDDSADFGNDQIMNFYYHFKAPLDHSGFDNRRILAEWKSFKTFVRHNYAGFDALPLWKKIIQYRKSEYKNLCLLANLMLSISGSNSSVERAFSILSIILSDRRLSMNHDHMESIMLISGNKNNWTKAEKDQIIDRAVDIYLSKRRTLQLDEFKPVGEPPVKVMVIDDSDRDSNHTASDKESSSDDDLL